MIILQEEIAITETETVGSLHDKLMVLGAGLVARTVDLIASGNVKTKKQPELEEKSAPKLFTDNTKIDWSACLNDINNKIRGLNPFPGAWTIIKNGDEEISAKIYGSENKQELHNYEIGTLIFSKKEIKVAVKNGFIKITEIKLAGKKKMDAISLLNGFAFSKNAKML